MGGFCRDLCDGLIGQCRLCMTTPITRKKIYWCGGVGLAIILLIVIISVSVSSSSGKGRSPSGRDALGDGLNAGPNYLLAEYSDSKTVNETIQTKILDGILQSKTLKVQIFSSKPPCESQFKDSLSVAMSQVDFLTRVIAVTSPLKLAKTSRDIQEEISKGGLASVIQINGGHALGLRLSSLRSFYNLGVRVASLVSPNCSTPWMKAVGDQKSSLNKLDDFGKAVIKEMNRLGILIDIAGVDPDIQKEIIDLSAAPVAAIGVGLKSAANSPLNLDTDRAVKSLASKKGIIMLTMDCRLLKTESNCTGDSFTQHLSAGIEDKVLLGFGGTLDPSAPRPKDLELGKIQDYFDQLYKNDSRKYSLDFLKGLAGLNFMQVLKDVEEVASKLQNEQPNETRFDFSKLGKDSSACYSTPVSPPTDAPSVSTTTSPSSTTTTASTTSSPTTGSSTTNQTPKPK